MWHVHFETRFLGEYDFGIAFSSANLLHSPGRARAVYVFYFRQSLGMPYKA
jgi:hypothetical protein